MKDTLHAVDFARAAQLVARPNWPRRRDVPRVDSGSFDSPLSTDGMLLLRGVVDPTLCKAVIEHHERYEQQMSQHGIAFKDADNRNYRLTNFHLVCPQALEIGCTEAIHQVLDGYFGRRSMVYTSLYFKHGSQQAIHIDTPFFVTNPVGWFAGVWVALEDVHPDAGPVEYVPRAHRLFDTEAKLKDMYSGCAGNDDMFVRIKQRAVEVFGEPVPAILSRGDVLIWHHGLPHGGRLAANPQLTRHSLVFHMGAEGVNVQSRGLFRSRELELPRYGVFRHRDRLVARASLPRILR